MGNPTKEGDSPVSERVSEQRWTQSRARHEKPCLKERRPLRKTKYKIVTDSEPVP